jgi:hypothetical protein
MIELAATLSIYVSLTLMYAAAPERLPQSGLPGRRWRLIARLAAVGGVLLAVMVAIELFSLSEGGRALLLVIMSAVMAATAVFIMLISLWPRGMWALALVSPPLIAYLVALRAPGF